MKKQPKYIFVTGGVASGLGKGINTASLGRLFKTRGVGVALFVALPDGGVAIAAVTAVALNVLADTVTFSDVIEGGPVLRWLDGLGRVRTQR